VSSSETVCCHGHGYKYNFVYSIITVIVEVRPAMSPPVMLTACQLNAIFNVYYMFITPVFVTPQKRIFRVFVRFAVICVSSTTVSDDGVFLFVYRRF